VVADEWPPWTPEFLAALQPGRAVRVFWNKANPNNEIRHIRAIIDDEYVAYRTWSKAYRRWNYKMERIYFFWLAWENGTLKPTNS
jgi:hypothetical protein